MARPISPGHSRRLAESECYHNRFRWAVWKFSECRKRKISSPKFHDSRGSGLHWRTECYPNGVDKKKDGYVSVYLIFNRNTTVELKMCVINAEGLKTDWRFLPAESGRRRWGFPDFASRDRLNDQKNSLLPEDSLTFYCEFKVLPEGIRLSRSIPRVRSACSPFETEEEETTRACCSSALELYSLAGKYKNVCEKIVKRTLDVERAAEALFLAHKSRRRDLELLALDFVAENIKEVNQSLETKTWKDVISSEPILTDKIIRAIIEKFSNKK